MSPLNTWKVVEPDNYYKSFIQQSLRPDGRDWHTARPVSVRVGSVTSAEGSATVRLGNTTVVCGIKAELCVPSLDHPDRGFVVPNVELNPCCSPHFKAGPPGEKAISTSQFLQNLLQNSHILDYKQLCIIPNKLAWCLYADVVCLDHDGNLVDSSVMALVAALQHLTLPVVTQDPDTEAISLSEQHTETIPLKEQPLSTTFGIYDSEVQLLDPSSVDESQCCGEVSIALQQDGSVCCTRKTGGRQVSSNQMEGFIKAAAARLPELHHTLQTAIQQHALSQVSIS